MAAGALLDGGGDAWSKDHPEILEHARGLGYDKVPGVSLPPADAPKETWISEMDKFNAWKASELAKPESERWWVTRPWTPLEGTVSPEGGGGSVSSGSASIATPTVSPVSSNPFYPMLVQEYEAPGLVDYSEYMPEDSLFGYEQYQSWTNPNSVNESIWNYQPPTIYASDPRTATGVLATPGGIIEGGYIRPTVGIEAATTSSPSTPVGSAGYPKGDPRNPEDRGGPDRTDGGGADADTQTRSTPFPSEFPIAIGAYSPNTLAEDIAANEAKQKALSQIRAAEKAVAVTTPLPTRAPPSINDHTLAADIAANKAKQDVLAAIAKAEKAVAHAGSDYAVERAQREMAQANALAKAYTTAYPTRVPPSINDHSLAADIAANKAKQNMIGLIMAAGGHGDDMAGWGGGPGGGSSGGSSGVGPGGVGGGVGKGY